MASKSKTGQSRRAPIIPVSAPISKSPSAPSIILRWPISFTTDKYSRKSLNRRGRRSAIVLAIVQSFLWLSSEHPLFEKEGPGEIFQLPRVLHLRTNPPNPLPKGKEPKHTPL